MDTVYTQYAQPEDARPLADPIPGYTEPAWNATIASVSSISALTNAITAAGTTPRIIELTSNITMSGAQITIPKTSVIFIRGSGGTQRTIDAQNLSRIFYNRGTLFLQNVRLINGDATKSGSSISDQNGGGVYSYSQNTDPSNPLLVIRADTEISSCHATYGGGVAQQDGRGMESTVRTYVEGGLFTKNTAAYRGGAFYMYQDYLSIANATITENDSGNGGAINADSLRTLEIKNSTISNNTARSDGAALYAFNSGLITISDSSLTGNKASRFGGAISSHAEIVITNTLIDNNESADNGGAIYMRNYPLTVTGTSVVSNNTSGVNGGAIYAQNEGSVYTVTVSVSGAARITTNRAVDGGGIYIKSTRGATWGPYISTLNVSGNAVIDNNTATGGGGGIYTELDSVLNVSGSAQLLNNTAAGDGGAIYFDHANLEKLGVSAGVTFANNAASRSADRSSSDDATYYAHIFATQWTSPFTQGYNNYDIAYDPPPSPDYTATKTADKATAI
ncbi:MAG: hypothetical protein LBC78_05640, partial [Oscillospiraceae bacterium]|nr:hypothetical protein [Oscillospiraceae bacterium]